MDVNHIKITKDNKFFVSCSEDMFICVWDFAKLYLIHKLLGHEFGIKHIVLSEDQKYLYSSD